MSGRISRHSECSIEADLHTERDNMLEEDDPHELAKRLESELTGSILALWQQRLTQSSPMVDDLEIDYASESDIASTGPPSPTHSIHSTHSTSMQQQQQQQLHHQQLQQELQQQHAAATTPKTPPFKSESSFNAKKSSSSAVDNKMRNSVVGGVGGQDQNGNRVSASSNVPTNPMAPIRLPCMGGDDSSSPNNQALNEIRARLRKTKFDYSNDARQRISEATPKSTDYRNVLKKKPNA